MSDIKDKITQKAIKFRDASLAMNKAIPLMDNLDPSELSKKIKENQESLNEIQDATKELFEAIDELEVMSGKGIQR